MVEQQTAASHEMAREAAALFQLLEQFNFDNDRAPAQTLQKRNPIAHRPVASRPVAQPISDRPVAVAMPRKIANASSSAALAVADWEEF